MARELIYANGIDGLTGHHLLDPLDPAAVAAQARRAERADFAEQLAHLSRVIEEPSLGLPFHMRPEIVAEAGWAIVLSTSEAPEIRAAVEPLVAHRRRQVGEDALKVLDHRPGEQWPQWLSRHGTAPGNVDPRRVPYYVLLVGSPERIPFAFQYELDVEYAVGRLHFDDAAGYRRYAAAVIAHEEGEVQPRDAAATFFATRHAFDRATVASADQLVAPLAASLRPSGSLAGAVPGRRIDCLIGEHATKAALADTLGGTGAGGRPALLFCATHGMGGWPPSHPDQAARHGALLCQDWPGPGRIAPQQYFAATDLDAGARVEGMVAFLFACYGAGTPRRDAFHHASGEPARDIAPAPFVARLPKALLEAGALAVIGHVERAWGYSFLSASGPQLIPFQNAIGRILTHEPVGHAMKDFNERYAALSVNLGSVLESVYFGGKIVGDADLASLWMERNDAQNYIVLGDPAVTLRTA